ncbi:hypothetical protein MGYG_06323 [Nannizzia gypsea CBS 118893]|uniref:Uncharacterized protein n=1 Tax=Arthroderma gypseum (strain ATCC MYA-4604 / CBS 118893) TaxID=535722 RepID=E4UYZ6_ARTGP|nr:hypothetical protein MGYG_06323 [Nannizzia gypsea CBS 118893]EFR03326.1 hypothetical protein MGYG_06323 [Nannizzia gypsea CBS 118893]
MHLFTVLVLSMAAFGIARPSPDVYREPTPFATLYIGQGHCEDGGDRRLIPFGESDSECIALSVKAGSGIADSLSTSVNMACITYNDADCKEKADTLIMKPTSCWNFSDSVRAFKCFV